MTGENKILNKKVFCKTSDGYGFAPVQIDENKWVVMMFESEEKFNNNQPVKDFLFEHDKFNDPTRCELPTHGIAYGWVSCFIDSTNADISTGSTVRSTPE